MKILGKLTKNLEVVRGGKHAQQVLLSIFILTVSLAEDSQVTGMRADLSAAAYYKPSTGFQSHQGLRITDSDSALWQLIFSFKGMNGIFLQCD